MAFSPALQTAFFTNAPQMGLMVVARTRLADEGLVNVADFEDFKPEQIQQALKNLRTAIPGVPGIAPVIDNSGILSHLQCQLFPLFLHALYRHVVLCG